jgi:hypothetical protein
MLSARAFESVYDLSSSMDHSDLPCPRHRLRTLRPGGFSREYDAQHAAGALLPDSGADREGSLVSYRLDVRSPAQRLGTERGYDRGGVPLLKRVVAACGDTVSVRANGIFVDGVLIPNSVPEMHDKQNRKLERAPLPSYRWAQKHPGHWRHGKRQDHLN